MSAIAIKQVSSKLKALPEELLQDVERYIDFLAFKYSNEKFDIPKWHKDIVLDRIKNPKDPIDAFTMIDDLDKEAK